jgi:3-hydroxybutyryl-CoA dehydrogenase
MNERLGIAGSGAIACGLAVTAAGHGDVVLWARSQRSEDRARANVERMCAKLDGHEHDRIRIVRDLDALHAETFVVEAVVEEHEPKAAILSELAEHTADDAILSTTTSSLSISALAEATGRAHTFVGLHVFNPVPRMKLVELVFPAEADDSTRERSLALCETLGSRGSGHPGVRRQPAAVPVPVQRRAADGGDGPVG